MNAFEEKMWERREDEMIGEKRGKKIGESSRQVKYLK